MSNELNRLRKALSFGETYVSQHSNFMSQMQQSSESTLEEVDRFLQAWATANPSPPIVWDTVEDMFGHDNYLISEREFKGLEAGKLSCFDISRPTFSPRGVSCNLLDMHLRSAISPSPTRRVRRVPDALRGIPFNVLSAPVWEVRDNA